MQPDHCNWTLDDLRANIAGIDTIVPLLDGTRVPYVFLDNGASTPAFTHVNNVLTEFMQFYSGVHRGTGFKSLLATQVFDEAHHIAGRFVGANLDTNTVIFGKNTTEVVNKLANRCQWREGDVVITTLMEHHSNDLPWRRHARVVHIGVDDLGFLDMDALAARSTNTRAMSASSPQRAHRTSRASAIPSTTWPPSRMRTAHSCSSTPHSSHRIAASMSAPDNDPGHIDFIAYSAHKMYAPYGIGVLVGSREYFTHGDPDMVGGGVVEIVEEDFVAYSAPPAKEEAGSPERAGRRGPRRRDPHAGGRGHGRHRPHTNTRSCPTPSSAC
jgi:cysteine desulfurase / selenocysteine lyase